MWASQAGKDNGYVSYDGRIPTVKLTELRDAPLQKLTKTFSVFEAGVARVDVQLTYELLLP